ncbi:energy transducer TonB [Massilia sp. MB5]|uniref:Protein TonB n=1 Tax=Pseudoduganella violacea TaxID=1715466 RepID=A0A7W5BD82_9BURK|nr:MULTISPECIES: energy transducer TonB [Telluria group]AKU22242.1 energy transducer TonB [Massilia sp. NR 4-1]MBB3121021.1 protein TonB [Pseudoduganella violacea]UMR32989.1 energy transducer TonB [Massilia sp. MB5]
MSSNKRWLSAAAVVLLANASLAYAAEVPASFDAKNCKAEYPKASLMNEEQGTVSMSFLVSAGGDVMDSKIEKSSGFKNLDKAAIKAISACKFKPGTKDGKPDQTWTKVDYAWKLD